MAISLIPHETIALLITMINSYDLVLQLARGFKDFGGDRQDLMLQVLAISAISFFDHLGRNKLIEFNLRLQFYLALISY
ncbi:hypothetical protein OAE26_01685 [Synechococcus sp. AH-551-E05]|nr:hypothetical protein [Synechococcus sp. AH-551-E05]